MSFSALSNELESCLSKANAAAAKDEQLLAFLNSEDITQKAVFGARAVGEDDTALIIEVVPGKVSMRQGKASEASFLLSALPEQWRELFKQTPVPPYQSYWGLVGMNNKQEGIEVIGDMVSFANWSPIWRRSLEILHHAYAGAWVEEQQEELDEDVIVGRYLVLKDLPLWGTSKVYYETSGQGPAQIVFCHTAGADGRQYNRVMNDPRMLEKCTMYALDLPAHGKSFPYENYLPGRHSNNEEAYVGTIAAFIKKLGLKQAIVCGASMAGQISLACAIHAKEIGCAGSIPVQGCDYLTMDRTWSDQSPFVNQALWNPEWIYGMMAPTVPAANKQLIWHLYSAQAYGIFHGDLDFYFGGWDGRDRMKDIDTKLCPVYMLTGEYDWSNTPEMSKKTCDKIAGAKFEAMKGMGHFPITENPKAAVEYLLRAVDHITSTRSG